MNKEERTHLKSDLGDVRREEEEEQSSRQQFGGSERSDRGIFEEWML